jgi:hypothetical protein
VFGTCFSEERVWKNVLAVNPHRPSASHPFTLAAGAAYPPPLLPSPWPSELTVSTDLGRGRRAVAQDQIPPSLLIVDCKKAWLYFQEVSVS